MDCFSGLPNRRKQYQKIFGKVQYIFFAALDHKNKAVRYSGFSTDIMVHGDLMPGTIRGSPHTPVKYHVRGMRPTFV